VSALADHLQVIRGGGADSLKRGDEAELAALLIEQRSKNGPVVYDGGTYREYSDASGVFGEVPDAELSCCVQGYAGAPVGDKKVLKMSAGTVRGTIRLACDLAAKPGFFDGAPRGVTFANGFVAVDNGRIRLVQHSPDNLARYRLEIPYEPTARHAELDRFWDQVFADATEDERAARVMLIQEFVGASLIGAATSYQRCLIFEGPGGNGKSQAEDIIRSVFPARTVCSLPPQQWGERFQISKLVGCLANIVDEIPEKEIVSGDLFKSVITGEPIHTERKHRDPFEHRPIAGHIFSANMLPSTVDLSHGFFRRFLIVKFTRDMENAPGSRKDIGKAIAAANLPGIAAWAIEGAARLQRNGTYTVPASSMEAVAEWKRSSDSVALFIDEKTEPADGARPIADGNGTRAAPLYASYREWCTNNGYRPVSSKNFAGRMDNLKRSKVRQSEGFYYPVRFIERKGGTDGAM
jgi:P4 family phage/plasmid primase-like protien